MRYVVLRILRLWLIDFGSGLSGLGRMAMNAAARYIKGLTRAGMVLGIVLLISDGVHAETYYKVSTGQVVYVPVYSDIFSSPKKLPAKMAVMLSIRNTDMARSITIHAADYYNTKGKLVKRYYEKPVTMTPLESIHIYIPPDDRSGGEGANFIVTWSAREEVNTPIIESIMVGRDLSIISPGQEIRGPEN
jgi:hypothetical protein